MSMPSAKTILLVEDDTLLRDAFQLLLEDAGYRVTGAGSVGEALQRVDDEVPGAVLLDLGLPDRPGLDVARALRAQPHTAGVPIIALTGRVGNAEQKECLDAGCTRYLAKPVATRELLKQLREVLA